MTFVGKGFDTADKDRQGQKPNRTVVTKIIGPGRLIIYPSLILTDLYEAVLLLS